MAIRCIPTTKEVEELARKLQGETVASVKALIALWQEKNNKDIDTFPTAKELNDFRAIQRKSTTGVNSYSGYIEPEENTIFVFGSNPEGRHGAGAAKVAREKFGAVYGQGEGLQGNAYALPTKDLRVKENNGLRSISTEQIVENIRKMYQVARENPDKQFKVAYTHGLNEKSLNGYTGEEMINMFLEAGDIPANVYFSDKWVNSGKFASEKETTSFREDLAKVSQTFTPIERKNRVNLITRLFSNKVTSALEIMKSNLNKRIEAATSYEQQRELIDDMTKLTRPQVIRRLGPSNIFKKVRQTFSAYTEATQEERVELELANINADPKAARLSDEQKLKAAQMKADRQYKSFMKILDNFQALAEEASANFSLTEGVVMDIRNDYNLDEDTNTDAVDEEGNSIDDSAENKEENYKDGWMTNVREVASYSSLSNRVRNIIRQIPRLNRRGTYDYDDLGYEQYLEPSYVHSELIQGLRDMVDARDMIPMLNKLASRKPWARQILQKVESDNQVFTAFYRAYRKDYLSYWIQKRKAIGDGSFKTETMSINKAEGTAHYFDEWRDNYEFGNILDSDSLYDKNGDIHLSKAKTGLEIVNNILSQFSRVDREDEIRLSNDTKVNDDLMKALNMLGISIGKQTLQESLNYAIDNTSYPVAIRQVLEALRTIYYDLNKGNDKVTDGQPADLVNIYGSQFNSIAEVFNFVDEDTVESSVRQGDKTRYAHVNPSYLTTLLKKLRREGLKSLLMQNMVL